jgi:exodeoxyribonuclease VII small subunit
VNALDNPRKSLDESLVLYERACRLSLYCHEELEKAKAKITELDAIMHKNSTKGQDDLIEE